MRARCRVFVIEIAVDDEEIVRRLSGRRSHLPSGRIYHTSFHPPLVEGKDDVTGEALIQRKDDTEETLKPRLATFHQQTVPVLKHYEQSVKTIDGTKQIKQVYAEIQKIVGPTV